MTWGMNHFAAPPRLRFARACPVPAGGRTGVPVPGVGVYVYRMPYCDHHGWSWEPGQGPSPCVGETASFILACSLLWYTFPLTKDTLHPFQRAAAAGSTAARIHAAQITLVIAQGFLSLVGGVLSARPRGMFCGAILLHSLSWPLAWFTSSYAMQRSPACSKNLVWFWCCALVLNSVVLSSLRHASEVSGRHLPAEIGCLSWISFFGNALLVVLQLSKPELGDTEGVYVRVVGREGVIPSTATSNGGWQAFWAGGGDTFNVAAVPPESRSTKGSSLCCFGGRRGSGDIYEGGGAWPIADRPSGAAGGGMLNESLLGTIGFGDRVAAGDCSSFKPKDGWNGGESNQGRALGGGFFRRVGGFLSSAVGRGDKATSAAASAAAAVEQEEGRVGGGEGAGWLQQQDSPFQQKFWGDSGAATSDMGSTSQVRSQQVISGSSSPSYSGASSIGVRAPPQVAAPIFGIAVTRWRLVDVDGVALSHGSSADAVWTDRSSNISSSSVRTATPSGSESASIGVSGGGLSYSEGSSSSMLENRFGDHPDPSLAAAALNSYESEEVRADSRNEPLRVQFELLVRASGRGEMDWWGRGEPEPAGPGVEHVGVHPHGSRGSTPTAPGAGDWRVWRSAADTLALYDALALRFGQDFCGRVPRPKFKTVLPSSGNRGVPSDKGSGSASGSGSPTPSSPGSSPLPVVPAAPHRVDILRDVKTIGAFLRSLLGLRQFLSTAVVDFLAQPPPASLPTDGDSVHGSYGDSENGSDDYFTSDEIFEEEQGSRHGTTGSSRRRRSFSGSGGGGGEGGAVGGGPSSAGQAVAVAALASDYGTWLKRLAVRLRRATPAGECFVRLRCIGPSVTGEQVVRWLVREKVCNGDRASAARLGQDMVYHGLLVPVCAGYGRPGDPADGGGRSGGGDSNNEREHRELVRSFDDAIGWLFAFVGDALRDPFAPPPPTRVSVMSNTGVDVRVTGWVETSDDDGAHVSFVVHTHVEATQEAWESPRRYREFTQLRKRLLRLGIDIPAAAVSRHGDNGGVGAGGELAPDLPKKTWRANKFDREHLETRRAALEAYLQAAVKAALSAPHLSGHLIMRFLDPDESNLRILPGQQQQRSKNPFAVSPSTSRSPRGTPGGGGRSVDGGGSGGGGVGAAVEAGSVRGNSVGERLMEERTEAEDFNTLTDSLGGFG